MSLTGTYNRSLDSKQRLAIPKRLREELITQKHPTVFLAPETEQALTLYSPEQFQRRSELLAESLPRHASLRNYRRLYYSQAEQIEVDSQGRIRLPERLMAFAGLSQDVVLLGVHDHVEIWDQDRWEKFLGEHAMSFDALAEAAYSDGDHTEQVQTDHPQGVTQIPR